MQCLQVPLSHPYFQLVSFHKHPWHLWNGKKLLYFCISNSSNEIHFYWRHQGRGEQHKKKTSKKKKKSPPECDWQKEAENNGQKDNTRKEKST